MTRRGLFATLAASIVGPSLIRKFNLTTPVTPDLNLMDLEARYLRPAMLGMANDIDVQVAMFCAQDGHKVGDTIQVRRPQRFMQHA